MKKLVSIFLSLIFFLKIIYAAVSVTPYGAAETVSGSCFLLEDENFSIIVDCGIFMDEDLEDTENKNRIIEPKLLKANALCLTHAHLDHSGKIPLLISSGFVGKIYSTNATKEIALELFKDRNGFDLIKRNWFWSLSQKERSKHKKSFVIAHWRPECKENIKSLEYSKELTYLDDLGKQEGLKFLLCKNCCDLETKEIEKHFITVDYNLENNLSENLTVKFINAGHIPGSASLMFNLKSKRILFSGDLGSGHSRFNGMFDIPEKSDLIFMEATYGSNRKNSIKQYKFFRKDLVKAISKNKIVWIPALSLNRTQKVLYELKLMQEEGLLSQQLPIYSVSPSANSITSLYQKELSNVESQKDWFLKDIYQKGSILPKEARLQMIRNYTKQMILFSSSGDLDKGKSFQLTPTMLSNKNVFVMLVSYVSPLSNAGLALKGKKLHNGSKSIASIKQYDVFSDHADFDMLQKWLLNQNKNTKIYIIHSTKQHSQDIIKALRKEGFKNMDTAKIGVSIN
ncbi:MAG: MBL fold metallo-hydrolase [Endomicrobium sp.]|jgi:metallo-beta-lactamase family protein|uniref:MBL fold metallo-hydrolase n=1 Tax=Candidatus Endomicrobiellum cubanum TaxID=3242325 RepID=UPI0028347874|nr:MBL fold metallo-hydrolase [Endomicrobium sp.]